MRLRWDVLLFKVESNKNLLIVLRVYAYTPKRSGGIHTDSSIVDCGFEHKFGSILSNTFLLSSL